jgi:hypothetical protein
LDHLTPAVGAASEASPAHFRELLPVRAELALEALALAEEFPESHCEHSPATLPRIVVFWPQ